LISYSFDVTSILSIAICVDVVTEEKEMAAKKKAAKKKTAKKKTAKKKKK